MAEAHANVSEVLNNFLTELGKSLNHEDLIQSISRFDDEMNKTFIYDRDEWWPKLMQGIFPSISLPKTIIKKLTRSYWTAYISGAQPYPDAITTLTYLKKKGYSLGLVSDTDGWPGMKRRRIETQPFKRFFDVTLVSGEDTHNTKPSPEPFMVAAEKLGFRPEECVFVGDKPFADIKGARRANMKTVLIHRREWNSDVEADHTITSLKELKHIL